jgi:hypothetical protein
LIYEQQLSLKGRRKREEGREKREEGRGKREEGRSLISSF